MDSIVPLLTQRRMVRWFADRDLTPEQEREIDTAILTAPSKQDLFPYNVRKIGNDEKGKAFKRALYAHPMARGKRYNPQIMAPLVYVFGIPADDDIRATHAEVNAQSRNPERLFQLDASRDYGIAASYAVMAAHSIGLATAFCGCLPWYLTSDEFDPEYRDAWNAVGEHKMLVCFGHRDNSPECDAFYVRVTTTFDGETHTGYADGNRSSRFRREPRPGPIAALV